MTMPDLEGRSFGPHRHTITAERVAAFAAATGADPGARQAVAPPAYAAALLFAVAPDLLTAAGGDRLGLLIHADQTFRWHRPLAVGLEAEVAGRVERVRERNGVHWVTFAATARASGELLMDSSSTFLMAEAAAGAPPPEREEPPAGLRAESGPAPEAGPPRPGATIGPEIRSASRADLVRYAAAGGDWNPIHWDHDSARAAGLAGIVVHGLLIAAWIAGFAAAAGADPLGELSVRFRAPLHPAEAARLTGTVEDVAPVRLAITVTAGDTELVRARAGARDA